MSFCEYSWFYLKLVNIHELFSYKNPNVHYVDQFGSRALNGNIKRSLILKRKKTTT